MSFNGDGDSIVVDFSEELAKALNIQTGKCEGTYVFLFDHKEWRYDKADTFAITINDNTSYLTNVFTQTSEDRIVVCLPEFINNEPITFERVR